MNFAIYSDTAILEIQISFVWYCLYSDQPTNIDIRYVFAFQKLNDVKTAATWLHIVIL